MSKPGTNELPEGRYLSHRQFLLANQDWLLNIYVASMCVWLGLFFLVRFVINLSREPAIQTFVKNSSSGKRWLLYSYIVSIFHACTLILFSFRSLFACEPRDGFKQTGWLGNTWVNNDWCVDNPNVWEASTLIIFLGYLTVDLCVCFLKIGDALKGKNENYAHHIIGIVGVICALVVGRMILTLSCATCFTELSTPFVSIRGILYMLKKSDTKIYFYNGLTMTLMFFLSRNVFQTWLVSTRLVPAVLSRSSHMFDQTSEPWVEKICWFSITVYSCLCLLNFYWFYKMVMGSLAHMAKSKGKPAPASKTD